MRKSLLGFLLQAFVFTSSLPLTLYGAPTLSPVLSIEVNATVKDMVLDNNTLVIATDQGRVDVYDYEKQVFTQRIVLPDVKDFMGDLMPARVYSVDVLKGRFILLSDSGKGGYANVWLYENGTRTQLLSAKDKLSAIKVRFTNKNHILLGLLSNEALLFDLEKKKMIFSVQLSESKFSDFALSLDRSQAVFACESGILNIIDTSTGKELKVLQGQNVDNVYKVDFKNDFVSAAGNDRRAAIYDLGSNQGTYMSAAFLIYATALSPTAKRVAFPMDEANNIWIYETESKRQIALLKGQKSRLNTLIFKDEQTLFSASDDSTVNMWKIP
ncbi:MAG: WD40 repeat domain-containing protein [Sulfurovum sp.]|nr:WD40 repeat domain-containing protein [Sulfurovum sp.]